MFPAGYRVFTGRAWLAVLLWLAGAACSMEAKRPPAPANPPSAAEQSLHRGAQYLWSRQAEDGGWHSTTYGLLRSGQSLTPFVLEALLEVPDDVSPAPKDRVNRAISFIRRNTDAFGAVGMMDPGMPDYPNYATALAVKALSRAGETNARRDIERMAAYLRSRQFSQEHGWRPDDAPYGAWGMGGEIRTPPNAGHVDLSMTRHVIEALAEAGVDRDDPVFQRARVFVERCQNYDPADAGRGDGGFYFSTVVLDANKAGSDGERYRSYSTATADGLLALLALGYSPDDARVRAAAQWLAAHHRADGAPGFVGEAYERWTAGLWFYYAASSSSAMEKLRIPGEGLPLAGTGLLADTRLFAGTLPRAQKPDGSWSNPENLVKEDDPLIATAFALKALIAATQPHVY